MSAHMSSSIEGFINPTAQLEGLALQRESFLQKQGWTQAHLARFGLVFCPNVPTSKDMDPPWDLSCHKMLGGYNYIAIPFYDFDGKPSYRFVFDAGREKPFLRIRRLDYPTDKSGKYLQYPQGRISDPTLAVYKPNDLRNPTYWDSIIADPSKPIAITEGEFDALAGYLNGLSCLGLTGLDCFIEPSTGAPAWPANQIVWTGRRVIVIPDQDAESTYAEPFKAIGTFGGVKGACERLVNSLIALGAEPSNCFIVRTPVGRANIGKKIGLTEYFKLGGTVEDLLATERRATGTLDRQLAELLQNYAIYAGRVFSFKTGTSMALEVFKTNNAPKEVAVVIDSKTKLIPATTLFLKEKSRTLIEQLVFRPDLAPGLQADRRTYNQFYGFAIDPAEDINSEYAKTVILAFEEWGARLWGSAWSSVRGHYAWMFQRPTVLRQHIVVSQSPITGIGKSAFFKILIKIIGPRHSIDTTVDDFLGNWNESYSAMILVLFDEMHVIKPRDNDAIKRQITSDTITIKQRYQDNVTYPWYGSFAGPTNKDFAVRFGEGDRRVLQATPSVSGAEKATWQPRVQEILRLLENPEALAIIHAYFKQPQWLEDYDPKQDAVKTDSFEASQGSALSQKENDAVLFYDYLPDVFCFDPVMAAGDGDLDKYFFDAIKALAETKVYSGDPGGRPLDCVTKAQAQQRLKLGAVSKQVWLYIYSKVETLPTRKDSQGHALLATEDNAGLVRQAIRSTREAVVAFKSRQYHSSTDDIILDD